MSINDTHRQLVPINLLRIALAILVSCGSVAGPGWAAPEDIQFKASVPRWAMSKPPEQPKPVEPTPKPVAVMPKPTPKPTPTPQAPTPRTHAAAPRQYRPAPKPQEPAQAPLSFTSMPKLQKGPKLQEIPGTACQIAPIQQAPLLLQGRAQMAYSGDPLMESWLASQAYRLGAVEMDASDLRSAASHFKEASGRFAAALGPSKFLGQAQFAQAQCYRLMGQKSEAGRLFQLATEQLRLYDPTSPFLQAGVKYLESLPHPKKAAPVLKAMIPKMALVDKEIVLQAKATQMAGGTTMMALKDETLFGGSPMLPGAAAVNLTDEYVRKAVYKGFLQMTCLETAAIGGNYLSAPDNYKSMKSSGKNIIAGASSELFAPVVKLRLNDKEYNVAMVLPGLQSASKNVMLLSDGRNVIALDPRTNQTWKLICNWKAKPPEFDWWKLTHMKTLG